MCMYACDAWFPMSAQWTVWPLCRFFFLFFDMKFKRWRIHSSPSNKIAYNLYAIQCLRFYFPQISAKTNVTFLIERVKEMNNHVMCLQNTAGSLYVVCCIFVNDDVTRETRSNMRQHSNPKSTKHVISHVRTHSKNENKSEIIGTLVLVEVVVYFCFILSLPTASKRLSV